MAVTTDIVQSWRRPRAVFQRKRAEGLAEARLLATLMGACLLIFVSLTPRLAREAHFDPSVPLDARMAGALMAVLFLVPLIAYALAGLTRLVARVLGGKGSGAASRLALFWSLLATTPLMLLHGLVAGFIGPSTGLSLLGGGVALVFLYIWGNMLAEAER